MLQFNINVGSSVYAKYYFDLRALADANDLSFPLEPLSKDRALKLEVITCSINAKTHACLTFVLNFDYYSQFYQKILYTQGILKLIQ